MRNKRYRRQTQLLESLEARRLLSASLQLTGTSTQIQATEKFLPTYEILSSGMLSPLQTAGPQGYTPAEIRTAYGLNQISFGGVTGDGSGQTIAIIDAYNDPTIRSDLHNFDVAFGLADPTLTVLNQNGGATLPPVDPVGPGGDNWEGEEALDVEWAHALAPGASIVLVEANDSSPNNLFAGVNFARSAGGVSVISMSFGGNETSSEKSFDSIFTTPAGHEGVTFVASTGDSGTPAGYPAYSPNVLAIGGTSLQTDSLGNYQSEHGWSGSGGGISRVEAQPAYQSGIVTQSHTLRSNPDVAFDADPQTGVAVYDSYNNGSSTPWEILGGTSVAAPSWAGIIAVINQGRVLAGKGTLDGPTGTLPLIYSAPAADFHDITSGNNGLAAAAGYDLVTGRGSPVANLLVPFMVTGTITPPPPPPVGPVISSLSASGTTLTEGETLTLTANGVSDSGGTGLTVTFYEETNGIAGLQTGAGGDFAFAPVTDGSNAISIDTSGSPGTFTFYAQLTDSSGAASSAGVSAPSVTVTVVPPSNSGPTIGTITAAPNPIQAGNILTLAAVNMSDPQSTIRRVTFYEETNGIPGLQTGVGGDFAFRSTSSVNNFSLNLDTTGVSGSFTFYAQALDFLGNASATGTLAPSATVNVVLDALPAAPTNLVATAVSPVEIDLAFAESSTNQTGFTIERSQDPNFASFTQVFSINRPDAVTYSDTGLTPGTRYYYRVQAQSQSGASPFSNVASAITNADLFPIGFVDVAGPAKVSGWAGDRDASLTAVTVQLVVDGSVFATQSAGLRRADLIPVFDSANHGFSFDLSSLSPGIHRIDVFALDVQTNLPTEIGTPKTIDNNIAPTGFFDTFNGSTFTGWAFDGNSGANSIQIRYVLDGGAPQFATASKARADLVSAVGSANHGFSIQLPQLTAGTHSLSVWAVDSISDALVFLGTHSAVVTSPAADALPLGNVDVASATRISGWAMDTSSPGASIQMRIDIDGTSGLVFTANLLRPDVDTAFHTAGSFGFAKTLSLAAGEHRIDIYALDTTSSTPVLLASRLVGTPVRANLTNPAGSLDVANSSEALGWAWLGALGGNSATVRLDIDNLIGSPVSADRSRPDVAALYGPGNYGFSIPMPKLAPGTHTLTLWIIDPVTLTPIKLLTRTLVTS